MDNENMNHSPETIPEAASDTAGKVIDESEAAFDYQPPEVEVPEPPGTDDLTVNSDAAEPEATPEAEPAQPEEAVSPTVTEKTVSEEKAPAKPVGAATSAEPAAQPVQQSSQQPSGIPPYTQQYYQYTPVNPALVSQQNTSDGFAVASLICGLFGLVSCCTVIPSFLAIIFGAISKAKNEGDRPTGLSTAGLILGILGVILNLLVLMLMFYAD